MSRDSKEKLVWSSETNTVCGSCTYVYRPFTPVGELIQSDVHAWIRPSNVVNEPSDRWFALMVMVMVTQERGLVMFQTAWTKPSSQQVLYYFMETPLHIYSVAEDNSQAMQTTHWFTYMLSSHEDRRGHVDAAVCASGQACPVAKENDGSERGRQRKRVRELWHESMCQFMEPSGRRRSLYREGRSTVTQPDQPYRPSVRFSLTCYLLTPFWIVTQNGHFQNNNN